jgi:hypothetical protein
MMGDKMITRKIVPENMATTPSLCMNNENLE